jgi:hypothetical protein
MNVDGYPFDRDALALLLTRTYYPERTDRESSIIRDWLTARGALYDRFAFSVRVGVGQAPNPEHLEGVQRNAVFSTKKRIDVLAWQGEQPTIVEVKERVTPAVLGQLQTYRLLFLEQYPDSLDPHLLTIGRTSDDDTIRSLQAHGVTVLLYDEAPTR